MWARRGQTNTQMVAGRPRGIDRTGRGRGDDGSAVRGGDILRGGIKDDDLARVFAYAEERRLEERRLEVLRLEAEIFADPFHRHMLLDMMKTDELDPEEALDNLAPANWRGR